MTNFVLPPVLGWHTMAYLDDVVIYSRNLHVHLKHLKETLKLLEQAGFKLNLNKCQFALNELMLLGFIVSANGVAPDPEKVAAIANMSTPRVFCRHTAGYATTAAPLMPLLRKDKTFKWGEEENALRNLKRASISAPLLCRPVFQLPFEIHTDAWNVTIGVCLMQRLDGKPHAIAYLKMKSPETRYRQQGTCNCRCSYI